MRSNVGRGFIMVIKVCPTPCHRCTSHLAKLSNCMHAQGVRCFGYSCAARCSPRAHVYPVPRMLARTSTPSPSTTLLVPRFGETLTQAPATRGRPTGNSRILCSPGLRKNPHYGSRLLRTTVVVVARAAGALWICFGTGAPRYTGEGRRAAGAARHEWPVSRTAARQNLRENRRTGIRGVRPR